ncbi:uncharacterized protein LOC141910491 [Tubulanus polymorphus]|uniref:uncharacterized protein LOC141910491 n=1 Tax=Tubulanus polymorphus TaxID=672921 RepID=UPI003DA26140
MNYKHQTLEVLLGPSETDRRHFTTCICAVLFVGKRYINEEIRNVKVLTLSLSLQELIFVLVNAVGVHGADFNTAILNRHNEKRSETYLVVNGVGPLVWDAGLAEAAQSLAEECNFRHSTGNYGENIYATYSTNDIADDVAAESAVDNWYAEIKYYNKQTGACSGGVCGHYTQVVWNSTTNVGCGIGTFPKTMNGLDLKGVMIFCQYTPRGNTKGKKAF